MNSGLVEHRGKYSVDETVEHLTGLLQAKGITLFAIVDHSGEAAKAGLEMPNTKVLIFGNPQAGTPLMLASPSIAIDLPLKILIAQSKDGGTTITHNSPQYLADRHDLPADLLAKIAVVEVLVSQIAE